MEQALNISSEGQIERVFSTFKHENIYGENDIFKFSFGNDTIIMYYITGYFSLGKYQKINEIPITISSTPKDENGIEILFSSEMTQILRDGDKVICISI